jgi:hypothetical protein
MGDRSGAIAALRRAIEIEPENPLFHTNLERLAKDGEIVGGRPPPPEP